MRAIIGFTICALCCCRAEAQFCNPNLENGTFNSGTAGWTLSGFVCNQGGWQSNTFNGGGVYINDCGNMSIDPCVTTTITRLCPNNLYSVTFKALPGADYNYSPNDSLIVRVNGTVVLTQNEEPNINLWRTIEITFIAQGVTADFQICTETNGTDAAWTIDDVAIRRGNGFCPSDLTGDGTVDGDDVIAFFERWDVGC